MIKLLKYAFALLCAVMVIAGVGWGVSQVNAEPSNEVMGSTTPTPVVLLQKATADATTTTTATTEQASTDTAETTASTTAPTVTDAGTEKTVATTTATSSSVTGEEGVVLGTTTAEITSDASPAVNESDVISEEVAVPDEVQETAVAYVPPQNLPEVSVAESSDDITLDAQASHWCAVNPFTVAVSGVSEADTQITLHRDSSALYTLELFEKGTGITVVFAKNNSTIIHPGINEEVLGVHITTTTDSQKGSFNIPVVYTQKGYKDVSVVCQLNIINQ